MLAYPRHAKIKNKRQQRQCRCAHKLHPYAIKDSWASKRGNSITRTFPHLRLQPLNYMCTHKRSKQRFKAITTMSKEGGKKRRLEKNSAKKKTPSYVIIALPSSFQCNCIMCITVKFSLIRNSVRIAYKGTSRTYFSRFLRVWQREHSTKAWHLDRHGGCVCSAEGDHSRPFLSFFLSFLFIFFSPFFYFPIYFCL